jgi:phosphatidylglycerophosphatase A
MKKKIIYFIATAFGLGYLPLMPGTWTSLVTALLLYFWPVTSLALYSVIVALTFFAGIYFTGEANRLVGEKDKSIFSLDEVLGQLVALYPVLFITVKKPIFFIIAFILFRFFDIIKPAFIKQTEKVKGGLGVMLDDLLAGVYSAVLLQLFIVWKG